MLIGLMPSIRYICQSFCTEELCKKTNCMKRFEHRIKRHINANFTFYFEALSVQSSESTI